MENIVHGVKVDYDRDSLFSESGLSRLKEGYPSFAGSAALK